MSVVEISETRYVEVPGLSLGYEVISDGSGKPPLVMIHGYGLRSTGPLYTALYRELVQAFTIYALDTRGHGASAHVIHDWSFTQMAADVGAAVANLGLKGAAHAGHSYGGFLGLLTELYHPGTFRALNLLAPAAASGGKATPDEVKRTISTNGRDRGIVEGLFAGMYVRPLVQEEFAHAVDAVVLMDLSVHETYFWREFDTMNIMDRLSEISTPALFVTGGRDVVVSPEETRATAMGLPNAKEVSFSSEGHMLPLESPALTAREVIRFMQDLG